MFVTTNADAFESYRRNLRDSEPYLPSVPAPSKDLFLWRVFLRWEVRYRWRKWAILGQQYLRPSLADTLAKDMLLRRNRERNAQFTLPPDFTAVQVGAVPEFATKGIRLDIADITGIPTCGPSLFALWTEARAAGKSLVEAAIAIDEWAKRAPSHATQDDVFPETAPDLLASTVSWRSTEDLTIPWEAKVAGQRWQVRINDFPEETMYSLLIDGAVAGSFHDWPETWDRGQSKATPSRKANVRPKPLLTADFEPARLLDRYKSGECEGVWRDLVALGPKVRDEPYRPHAEAVAEETMLRARHNLGLIVERLETLRYKFVVGPLQPCSEDDLVTIASCEENGLHLPLAVRAFLEQVGYVSLIGTHAKLGPKDRGGTWARTDALTFTPNLLENALDEWTGPEHAKRKRVEFDFGADSEGKVCILEKTEVESHYWVELPDPSADPILHKPPDPLMKMLKRPDDETFVEYLRRSLQWGGFPGWEIYPVRPEKELALLQQGLLPL